MRYITVPDDVPITIPGANAAPEPMSFAKFAILCWLNDNRAITGPDGKASLVLTRRWGKVIDALSGAKSGDVLALDDEDYARLLPIVEAPAVTMQFASAAVQCLPLSDAVVHATEVAPSA